jgi:predicted nucleic acid-binding protein
LIDTNVVCDYVGGLMPSGGMYFLDNIVNVVPNLSVITQIELLSWNADETTRLLITQFILDSHILNITADVVAHCVAIRQARKLKTPDALIAATALANDLTLVTRNITDFMKVEGLRTANPWEL